MEHEASIFHLSESEKQTLVESSQYIYGDAFREGLSLKNPVSLPRYAKLGRKALSHYLGDKYNPHTVEIYQEYWVREHIKRFVEFKVFYKIKGYDWEFLDQFFRKVVGDLFKINIPYDLERIKQGIKPEFNIPPDLEHKTLTYN
ncbi:hypothetical protein D3C87_297820 [compost metagenome]